MDGVKLPQPFFCFAFLGEVDFMAFGVHGVHVAMPSLSGVLLKPQFQLKFTILDTKMDTKKAAYA
jgi:hypothetical protein